MQRRKVLSLIAFGALESNHVHATVENNLWLASRYRVGVPLESYWVSEKYDGIRGYWNGHQLLTRSGKVLNPPSWFTINWPKFSFEGELWLGRGEFERTASILQQQHASEKAWKQICFQVFDLPSHSGIFTERVSAYRNLVVQLNQPWVKAVEQYRISSNVALNNKLTEITNTGAEGLMLHLADSRYQAGRSSHLLKVKPIQDAEALVIGHVNGQGKHTHRIGALIVETPEGLRFKLGTGLTDAQRESPPRINQWVTYSYRGLTSTKTPRFASFIRVQPAIER